MVTNKIDKIDKQIEKLETEKKILKRNINNHLSRKERTRRLIQIGALAEKYFDISHNNLDEVEEIFLQFSSYIKHKKLNKHKKNLQ